MEEIEPENEDGDYGNAVADEAGFRAARSAVLADPERNPYLAWPGFRFRDVDRRLGTYARVGITPVVLLRHGGSGSTRQANLPPWMANVARSWAASPAHRNEIVSPPTVADGRLALDQPPSSVVLIAIHRGPDPGAPVTPRVEPEFADLERSRVLQLRAVGTFTDGTETDVSDRVSWSSAAPEVVRVNSTGLAVGLAPGTADLTASWDDLSSTPAPLAVR